MIFQIVLILLVMIGAPRRRPLRKLPVEICIFLTAVAGGPPVPWLNPPLLSFPVISSRAPSHTST